MRRSGLILCALALVACREPDDPKDVAAAFCKAHYDILMRWITGHGRYPEGDREINEAAQATKARDPWGNAYFVEVEENQPRIWSWGPDGEHDTDDDICYPPLEGG
jgi:hypothetical protein